MRKLYIEIKTKNEKEIVKFTGRFKIIEDNKQKAIIHNLLPMTIDWEIEILCRKLGFKNSYDCLNKSMHYIFNNNLLPKLRNQTYMFGKPCFCVNKYKKKIFTYFTVKGEKYNDTKM